MPKTTPTARRLRKSMTDAEALLWRRLRNRQCGDSKFRRQAPIGPYIVDFLCWDAKLIIELDGGQHANDPSDRIRQREIESLGFRVLRFWNNDVLENMEGVFETILGTLR